MVNTNFESTFIKIDTINNITYKFSKFDTNDSDISDIKYMCTFWSSNLGNDPNDIFGREFTQEEFDNLFSDIFKEKEEIKQKKLTKSERERLKRHQELEETRKAMGL